MKRVYAIICKGEVYVAAVCFTVSCFLIFLAAVLRSVGHPINWAQDISLFLFAWSVLLSADVTMRADKLVNVEVLYNRFPERQRDIIAVVNYVIILVFLAALVYLGVRLSYFTRIRSFQGIPGFSYTWITLAVPVGSVLLFTTVSLKLKDRLAKIRAR